MYRHRTSQALALAMLIVGAIQAPGDVQAQNPAQLGQWGPLLDEDDGWSLQTIHTVMLHTGKVLCVATENRPNPCFLFDPDTNTVSEVFYTPSAHNVFCAGHAALPDGRIVFAGGGDNVSQNRVSVYDPRAGTLGSWTLLAEPLAAERFYPTCTTLADGRILTVAGYLTDATANTPEIFDASQAIGSQWSTLPDATYCGAGETCGGTPPPYDFHIKEYPFMFQLATGPVLYAGENITAANLTTTQSRTLDVPAEIWTDLIDQDDPAKGGSAVMYAIDKVMKAGGFDPNGDFTAAVYRLHVADPPWATIASMKHARQNFYLIALPDGGILAVGGENEAGTILKPEILADPDDAQSTWIETADMAEPRLYHSAAVLLPDARVIIAGGETVDVNYETAQIFSPPYLFASDGTPLTPTQRPAIECVSTDFGGSVGVQDDVIRYGTSFKLCTRSGEAGNVTAISLIRPGAATHSFDQNQRLLKLEDYTVVNSSELSVPAPASGNHAPPGYYMLFMLDDGVPSVAKFVNVCGYAGDCNGNGVPDDCDINAGLVPDCNRNLTPDLCDVTSGFSQDCNANVTPDECEGGPFPAELVACHTIHEQSLWRLERNIIRLTFACDVPAPLAGDVTIQQLKDSGGFEPNVSSAFNVSIDNTPMGFPRILKIAGEPVNTLADEKWYAVRNAGAWDDPATAWPDVAAFELHYAYMIGDATNDNNVLSSDVLFVNSEFGCFENCDERKDLNGDGFVLSSDVLIADQHVPSFAPTKPTGHDGPACGGCCP